MPLILIPLVIVGLIMLLMIPFMLIYMVFKFLAFPIMIILGIWLYTRITGRDRRNYYHTNRAGNHPRFSQQNDFMKGNNRRKDVTDTGHDSTVHRQDKSTHWDDF